MTKPTMKDVPLSDIRIDGGTQPRAEINQEVVAEYKLAFENGANFPQAEVFYDGTEYWLADGFHRFHAAKQSKQESLDCRVHNGTQREAILFSVGANAIHGLRRSNADKRKAVLVLLNDEEWGKWSAREVAEKCGVGHTLVNEIRSSLDSASSEKKTEPVKFRSKHGTEATMKTDGINATRPPKPKPASDPEADRAAAIMASQKTHEPAEYDDGPDREKKQKHPPRVTSNGNLGLFDATDQRSWREAYGVIHRLMAKGLKADFRKFGPIDAHLEEFYKKWVSANPGKWS